jgi:dihydropteroate synthase
MGSPLRGQVLTAGACHALRSRRPLIMGIINITPDSFSDGGKFLSPRAAYRRAQELVLAGADIVDLGAESTRPGAKPVSVAEEKKRLLPVIKQVTRLSVPISVDTYKPEVAEAALDAGAQILNDITGLRQRPMRQLAAKRRIPVVIMHMRGTPQNMQRAPRYRNVVEEVTRELLSLAQQAEKAGVARKNIILDPGIGFGKTAAHNLQLLQNLPRLLVSGYRILVGPSRKSFIAAILGPLPPQERTWGTAAAVALAVYQGVHIVRVHDVREMQMVAQVAQAISRGRLSGRRRAA